MYRLFLSTGDMNLDRINQAGEYLLGEHDFRNFCKMDVANGVTNYTRRLSLVKATPYEESSVSSAYQMCLLTIRGKAFLWHQVRCIVAVLFRSG